jgi:hypothetical protein
MRALDDMAFDGGIVGAVDNINNGFNGIEFGGNGMGLVVPSPGGGGGGSSATFPPIIPGSSGTINADLSNLLYITSNEAGASIFINGENTYKVTPQKITNFLSDTILQQNGAKRITLQKEGFESNCEYVINVVNNNEYQPVYSSLNFNTNAFSSMFMGGMSGNMNQTNYNGLIDFSSNQVVYGNVHPYKFRVAKYENGVAQTFDYDEFDEIKNIEFILNKKVATPDPTPQEYKITVTCDSDDRVIFIKNQSEKITLKGGLNTITGILDDLFTISTADASQFRVIKIDTSASNRISETLEANSSDPTNLETLSATIKLDSDYNIVILTDIVKVTFKATPTITLNNTEIDRIYNINSKADVPIGINYSGNLEKVTAYVNNQKFEFRDFAQNAINSLLGRRQNLSSGIIIPAAAFSKIGIYKIILVPSNDEGDGDSINLNYNVVDDVYVGVPDLTNIRYPSELRGPDYIGTDVDFTISWESVSTDYVRIYSGTGYYQVAALGEHSLNVKKVLELGNNKYSENEGIISFQLKLVPYNISGKEAVVGKEEIITIKFNKGKLTITRIVALNRLAEAFRTQIDSIQVEDDSSKYLTHLLHFGGGDNKVITTWTGSEGSIVAKLYEPIPTSVQPNQLVWISKLQSSPIVEVSTLVGQLNEYCTPLKGPNFSIESENGLGYRVFEDLVSNNTETSANLIKKYTEKIGIDTTNINIQYVSGSEYMFSNFVNFSSAEEKVNNFLYKVELIENYQYTYDNLILNSASSSYAVSTDTIRTLDYINSVKNGFDGFEHFLYNDLSDLAYPKVGGVPLASNNNLVTAWYNAIVADAGTYDKENPNYLANNLPEYLRDDSENDDFITFLDMIGHHFDSIWMYINGLKQNKLLEHKSDSGILNQIIYHMLESMGWQGKRAFDSQFLWEYAFGTNKDGTQKYGMSLSAANDEVWRRILNNLPYLLKHKGTGRAMKAIMACYGVPQSMLTIMEFGGPQDPTTDAVSQFTFDDRTAAILLDANSSVKIPWHVTPSTGENPNCIEFRIKPTEVASTATLISGSGFKLDLIKTTGSFGKLELNFGADSSTSTYFAEPFLSGSPAVYTTYVTSSITYVYGPDLKSGSLDFPISTEYYSNVVINRHDYSGDIMYEVWLGTSDGQRIITSVSMSIFAPDTEWESGSFLLAGGEGYVGNMDEFRLWNVPLQRSKFDNHTLFPDAINGNSYTASTSDLLFRLDFEYPKDRTNDNNIKNVSINTEYGEQFAYAQNFYSASTYPYQYTPYDRTVTANVPSLGFSYGNKIRFESSSLVGDLSYKARATKKAFDRAPIDSNRLGLFFSPIKELNMDILKAFGDFNIDNYIGDYGDEYKDEYRELGELRHYYFERLDRNINEYIQLVRCIDKSLFDVLADLAPARAKVSKGLLIEPHYLERSKTRWNPIQSERNDYETFINIDDNTTIESSYESKEAFIDATDVVTLSYDWNNFEASLNVENGTVLEGFAPFYDTLIQYSSNIEATAPMYNIELTIPNGESLVGEVDSFKLQQIGMDKNSLSNLGFGLFAIGGESKITKYDEIFGNTTSSIQNVFLTKNQSVKKVSTQISGWPTNGANPGDQVRYADIPVTSFEYKVSIVPMGDSVSTGGNIVEASKLNGYFPTHYIFKNNLAEGLKRSFWQGSIQTTATTPDGLDPVETFTTNPNILRVAKTGRGSGEPILEVD